MADGYELDGYQILAGNLISGQTVTSSADVEVVRFTAPANADFRLNATCIVQNPADGYDGYSYKLTSLCSRENSEDGYILYGDTIREPVGAETDLLLRMDTDGSDIILKTSGLSGTSYRVAAFSSIYQVDNTAISDSGGGPPVPGDILFWYESNDLVLSPDVSQVNDQSGNDYHLTYATQATYAAAGGPAGGPAWITDQTGLITSASLANTPCQNPQTVYAVYKVPGVFGVNKILATNDITAVGEYILLGTATNRQRTYIYDAVGKAMAVAASFGIWVATRFRWDATNCHVKISNVAESTDVFTAMVSGNYWNSMELTPSSVDVALMVCFDEDAVTSGNDSDMQTYITDTYGLSI